MEGLMTEGDIESYEDGDDPVDEYKMTFDWMGTIYNQRGQTVSSVYSIELDLNRAYAGSSEV